MDRKEFNRYSIDLVIGIICGLFYSLCFSCYVVLVSIALIMIIIGLLRKGKVFFTVYGHDAFGRFRAGVVATRVITVNIGMVFTFIIVNWLLK